MILKWGCEKPEAGCFGKKTRLSVGGPINSVCHNCGKEKVGQVIQLAHDTVISNPQFSQWQHFLCIVVTEVPFELTNQRREIVVAISLAES
jgi:hypothetical protein